MSGRTGGQQKYGIFAKMQYRQGIAEVCLEKVKGCFPVMKIVKVFFTLDKWRLFLKKMEKILC